MEIRVLRYFLETAREENMTRAAERLHVSQPTMSKQLKELENELGAKLFTRSNYSIKLTEAGMLLKERAEDILSLVDKTEAEFRSLEEVNSGDIYVGAPESEAMSLFAEAVRDLQQLYPRIRCNIYSGDLESVCDRLDKGLLDFAMVMSYVDLSKYNYLKVPAEDTWGLLMRKDDPIAKKGTVSVRDLKGLPLICSKQWTDQEFPQWFGRGVGDANIVATYNLAFNGSVMVKAGLGYAVVLDHLIDTGPESGLVFRPLKDVPRLQMYVIWRKYQTFTPAAEILMNMLKERFL
ncbi:MAG: LysR family transcriptional regulator [Oscillospiraceae bacterium]|nr:LysR family transcriptional regulator [Oscillospiraceae bacterium]